MEEFCATTLPALIRATNALVSARRAEVRLIIHTDCPERVEGVAGPSAELRAPPAGMQYFDCMSQAHREVLSMGLRGDVVVPLTAGAVISEQGLVYCADVLDNDRLKVILCAVPRVLSVGPIPDTGDAGHFMRWAMDNQHPMTKECTWPHGRSVDLSRTFFRSGGSIVTRLALPHPLAIRMDGRRPNFTPTIDANLIQCYDPIEMHMAVDCDRLALIKLTPADKAFQRSERTMRERLENYELRIDDSVQRWCLGHKVVLAGKPRDCGDDEFIEHMLSVKG